MATTMEQFNNQTKEKKMLINNDYKEAEEKRLKHLESMKDLNNINNPLWAVDFETKEKLKIMDSYEFDIEEIDILKDYFIEKYKNSKYIIKLNKYSTIYDNNNAECRIISCNMDLNHKLNQLERTQKDYINRNEPWYIYAKIQEIEDFIATINMEIKKIKISINRRMHKQQKQYIIYCEILKNIKK